MTIDFAGDSRRFGGCGSGGDGCLGGSRFDVGVLLPRVAAGVDWCGGAGWRRRRFVADRSRSAGVGREVSRMAVHSRCAGRQERV